MDDSLLKQNKHNMRLLVVTQKVDTEDDVLGFFHTWLIRLSERVESLVVICLEEGTHHLPPNVHVHSLGKERRASKLEYIFNFYHYIWRYRNEYDNVFVHMNPEYVVLGGLVWRLLNKPIGLWYVHRSVDLKLRIAARLVDRIFTTTKEACRVSDAPIRAIGHGIDMEHFTERGVGDSNTIAHMGRITPIKHIDMIAEAAKKLGMKLHLYGGARSKQDVTYKNMLAYQFKDTIVFGGSIPFNLLPDMYEAHAYTVNAAPTGGMDKSVLESWALGIPAFVRNEAFKSIFGAHADLFMFRTSDELAQKITAFKAREDRFERIHVVRDHVRATYNVRTLIETILTDSVYVRN